MLLLPTVTDSVIDDIDNDDDDDGALVSRLPSSANSPSPSCGNPAATDQSTVGLLTDDPALWPKKLTTEERCAFVRKGPIQISVLEFPKNQEGRRFTSNNYCFQMKNGEKINRTWLIYSESGDCVMCCCCRLFGEGNTHLSSDGFNNWRSLFSLPVSLSLLSFSIVFLNSTSTLGWSVPDLMTCACGQSHITIYGWCFASSNNCISSIHSMASSAPPRFLRATYTPRLYA